MDDDEGGGCEVVEDRASFTGWLDGEVLEAVEGGVWAAGRAAAELAAAMVVEPAVLEDAFWEVERCCAT